MTTVLALGSRLRAMRPLQQDALLAAVLTAAMLVEEGIQLDHSRHGALTVVLVVLIGATLVCRRQAPAAATGGCTNRARLLHPRGRDSRLDGTAARRRDRVLHGR